MALLTPAPGNLVGKDLFRCAGSNREVLEGAIKGKQQAATKAAAEGTRQNAKGAAKGGQKGGQRQFHRTKPEGQRLHRRAQGIVGQPSFEFSNT